MDRCSPEAMRQNLEAANILAKNGIDFVPIPVGGKYTKEILEHLIQTQLETLSKEEEESKENE